MISDRRLQRVRFNDGLVDVVGTVKGQPTPADQVALASADLVDPDLTSLGDSARRREQYSFVFDGNAQALDHVLVNELALTRFTRMAYARSDADFPESLRGDATRPERLSDHDAGARLLRVPDGTGRDPRSANRRSTSRRSRPSPIRAPPHTTRRARCRSR